MGNVNIQKDFKNDLLNRREVVVRFESESNPGLVESNSKVVSEFKSSEDKVVIKRINSIFGSNEFVIEAYVYDSVEDKDKVEPKKKEKKKVGI